MKVKFWLIETIKENEDKEFNYPSCLSCIKLFLVSEAFSSVSKVETKWFGSIDQISTVSYGALRFSSFCISALTNTAVATF